MSAKVETIHTVSNRKVRPALTALVIFLVLLLGGAAVITILRNSSGGHVIAEDLSAPLGSGAGTASVNTKE